MKQENNLIHDFTQDTKDNSSIFEKNCMRNILAKITLAIQFMDLSEITEENVEMINKLSTTAISIVDEIKYLEKIETNGFE